MTLAVKHDVKQKINLNPNLVLCNGPYKIPIKINKKGLVIEIYHSKAVGNENLS